MCTRKVRVVRYSERASYDRDELIRLLSRNFICHVGFIDEGEPYVIPMLYVNDDQYIYMHGSPDSRLIKIIGSGSPIVIAVTEVHGIVLSSNLCGNSINYESAIIYGRGGSFINDSNEKLRVFQLLINRLVPGRLNDTELPTTNELESVAVVRIKIEDFAIKKRDGGPVISSDRHWEGIIPIIMNYGMPISTNNKPIPKYLMDLIASRKPT
ncbi:pyridoxamine 5'-phosphate oxidase family protein [Vulcanisaeta distributa]|uniref:pyridoxamine 5'-phosphate oxidase family protein n=1 Tax=Vulcanisaeta distributa TaxID=164451 RepID=UPI0006D2900E|nr:pyridoxamine 5'-phosphate oxidase family protein [Vulcanisaeta distributa]